MNLYDTVTEWMVSQQRKHGFPAGDEYTDGYVVETVNAMSNANLLREISDYLEATRPLPHAGPWTHVNHAVPATEGDYLAVLDDGRYLVTDYRFDTGFHLANSTVVWWMTIPGAPK